MRRSAASLAMLLLLAVGCTSEPSRHLPSSSISPPERTTVVPNVVGENFLEALVAVDPQFDLRDVRYRKTSAVPNGTILRQRPPAGTPEGTKSGIRIRVVVSIDRE
jgi:beta-lactam-binding protein with PASTA domain